MRKILGLLCGSVISVCAIAPVRASSIQMLTTREASGEYNVPEIKIPRGHTVNLSFIPSGETIRQVHIDDRSRILLRFDAPLCEAGNAGSCSSSAGASVISLSQLADPIRFTPNERNAYTQQGNYRTTLTVVTTRGRQRSLYTFELVTLDSSTTGIRTVQIVQNRTPIPVSRTAK